tara:strand:- start:2046 stop:5636 length:3591 start_codon:yes stop_codon:yes gene_type:complete
MVNTTQFYKTKVALAVVLSLGLAACGDSEGDAGSTSVSQTDASGAGSEAVNKATGSIQGVVLDTNGAPVVGATVTVAGKTATTDTSGSYLFDDVQVTNVAGADANTGHAPFVIVIQAPEGYASTATVNVTPNAQIDAANATTTAIPLTTFVDGFLAQAGTAILPEKNSVIEGWIRNVDTGEAIVGAVLSLDFTGLSSTVVSGGANIALSGDLLTTTTGADGSYRFEGTYNDSVYNLSIQDYNFTSTSSTSNTADVAAVEAYSQAASTTSTTITTNNKVKAGTTPVVTVAGGTFTDFIIVDGVITSDDGSDILTGGEFVSVSYTHEVTTTTSGSTSSQTSSSTPATTAEGVEINMGTQNVRMITSSDTISPYVSNIVGWIKTSVSNYAVLNDGVNEVFVIEFSEPLDAAAFNADDVIITDGSSTQLAAASVELADDGRSVTVTMGAAQEPGQKISVFMPWQDTTDVAGNYVSVTANDSMDVDFDSKVSASKTAFLRVNMCVFKDAILDPSGFEAVQYFDRNTTEDAGSEDLTAYSNAFLDNHDEVTDTAAGAADTDLRQLNGDDTDTATLALALAQGVDATVASTDTDHAAVVVTKGEAASYSWSNATSVTDTDYGSRVWFDGVESGDTVKFSYNNDLGLSSGSVTVTLVDAIKPTTSLQENYALATDANSNTIYTSTGGIVTDGGLLNAGGGGEVTEIGVAATVGNPIIFVQPRHLTPTIASTNVASTVEAIEFDALTENVVSRSATTTETPQVMNDSGAGADQPIYDDAAWAAWTAAERENSMGFGFIEDIALVTGTAPVYVGTNATITNYSALNDVTKDIDGNTHTAGMSKDLVRAEVSDMVALANENHGKTVSFTGAIQDAFANIADADSRATVVFNDAMPPMVTNAQYNGNDFVVVFNEAIGSDTALNGQAIIIEDLVTNTPTSITLSTSATGTAVGAFTVSADRKTLTVQTGTQSSNVASSFKSGTANEFEWDEIGSATLEKHAALNWDAIPDAKGNQWAFFDADTVTGTPRFEVEAPRFYIFDNVGAFTYSVATAGYLDTNASGDDNGVVTYTITFSHPIELATSNAFTDAINANLTGTPAAGTPITDLSFSTANQEGEDVLDALFSIDFNGDGVVDAIDTFDQGVAGPGVTNGSLVIGNSNTSITLTISADDDLILFNTTDFGFLTTTTSAINTSLQTASGTFTWQNTN